MSDYSEPTLRDLLDDAIVRAVMASDGVAGEDVRRLFAKLLAPPAANARRAAAGPVGAGDGRQAASAKGTEETPVRNENPLTTIGTERLPAVLRYRGLDLDARLVAQQRRFFDLCKSINALLAGFHELAARQGALSRPTAMARPVARSGANGIGAADRPGGAEIVALLPIREARPARPTSAMPAGCGCHARRGQADEKRVEEALLTIGMEIDRPLDQGPGGRDAPAVRALRIGRR